MFNSKNNELIRKSTNDLKLLNKYARGEKLSDDEQAIIDDKLNKYKAKYH